MTDPAEILEDLLAEHEADEAAHDALLLEVGTYLFGVAGQPVLSLDQTFSEVWHQWDEYTGRVDDWEARYILRWREIQAELKALPRGKTTLPARRELKEQLLDAEWRRDCARYQLYDLYPAAQETLRVLLHDCWEESGVDADSIDDRLDEWGNTLSERRALYQLHDWTLWRLAAYIAADGP